ncbi:MAG TPA: hypothetical protein VG276_05395 [Actinomycetes bacterium]|jgi:hypothetical protein|nr:hypothetical protein [Actinomycetes bacterium]
MDRSISSQRVRAFALAAMVALLLAGGTLPAKAGPPVPTRLNVELGSAAGLAPDGQSVGISLLARCPERWTVLQALVTVSQPQASGQASFPLTCTGLFQAFTVTMHSSDAPFQLGQAQATASVRIQRGRTEQAQDSQLVRVEPTVLVDLADTALLEGGGEAVLLDVTAACPVGATGQQSYVNVSQGQASGNGIYVPTCDGQRHTFTVRVQTSQALFQPGSAQSLTFAFVAAGGNSFSGIDEQQIQIS